MLATSGLAVEHSFLVELNHVTEPALAVGWCILDVTPAPSVGEGVRGRLLCRGGFPAGTLRRLLRLARRIRERSKPGQRQTNAGEEDGQANYDAKVEEC